MDIVIDETSEFQKWVKNLRDKLGRARILRRIAAARNGNFGDCAPIGDGVSEMRLHFGPGYRIYYGQRGEQLYLLIAGGDKGSQKRDIEHAKQLWRDIKDGKYDYDQSF